MTTEDRPESASAEADDPRQPETDLRLRYANPLAAARATLQAHRDGEPDPLLYLEDELAAQAEPDQTRSER